MISVIVPIYNVQEYLQRCVDSIISQTYSDIEIILVDDGSTDDSSRICEELAIKDSRIKVFHITNGGVANARKFGYENSIGDFIVFVDPDDWLPLDSLEILISHINSEVDIVVGSFVYKSNKPDFNRLYKPLKLERDEFVKSILTNEIEAFPWRNLYRRKLFDSNSFPSIKRRQDLLMNLKVSIRVRTVELIDKIVYCYFQRDVSTSYQYNPEFSYEKKYWLMLKQQLEDDNMLTAFYGEYIGRSFQAIKNVFKDRNVINIKDAWVDEIICNIKNIQISKSDKIFIILLKSEFLQRVGICNIHIIHLLKKIIKKVLNRK